MKEYIEFILMVNIMLFIVELISYGIYKCVLFQTLHDLLFVRYLEERGLTADFCQSLVNFATHYEHSQYVKLLEGINDFVSK